MSCPVVPFTQRACRMYTRVHLPPGFRIQVVAQSRLTHQRLCFRLKEPDLSFCCRCLGSCLTLCDPMDSSGISQARTLEWVAMPSSVISFTNTVRNKIVRWVLATLWSSVISFLCRPDLTVGTADPETGNLYTMELMDSRWQWPRNQGGWGCCNGQQSQSSNQTIDSEHIECKGVQASLRKEFGPLPKIYTVNLSPSLL